MNDLQLIQKYLEGDESAFQALMERYLQPMYRFVFYSVQNQDQAEDIVQEIFIKIWSHLKKFDQQKNFKIWLYSIAKNTSLDFLKKKKMLVFSQLEQEEKIYEITDPLPLPSEILKQRDEAKILESALGKIPFRYREILLLYYRESFNFREIAEILKESINTVKSRQRRGLLMLKKLCTKKKL